MQPALRAVTVAPRRGLHWLTLVMVCVFTIVEPLLAGGLGASSEFR